MPELARLSIDDVSACGDAIREMGRDAGTMEEAAREIVGYLRGELRDGDEPACALVRLYKTHPFERLPADLQALALDVAPAQLAGDVRCLTLLGTAGDVPEWNDRRLSRGHGAIPLPSEEMVRRLPMVAALIGDLGLDLEAVVRPSTAPVDQLAQRTYDVFHVEDAVGSPYIPAHDFVADHGIRSAVGFGGMLHTGDLYAVVLFSKVRVPEAVAKSLRILALAVRIPLMRFLLGQVFEPAPAR